MKDSLDLSIAQYNFDKTDIENMKAMLFLLTNGDFETVSYVIGNNVDNTPVTIERMILLSLDVLTAIEFLQNHEK